MSKNKTRKGLALGTAIALVGAGFVSSPAYASDLSLVPSAGTTYSTLLSDDFTLTTAVTGNTNIANTAALVYKVERTADVAVTVSGEYWNGSAYANATLVEAGTGLVRYYDATNTTQAIGRVNKITLDPTSTSTTPTFSVKVTAFSDLDGSGTITSGDLVSPERTVTFVKGSEVSATVTLDALNAGVVPTASVAFGNDINHEQLNTADIKRIFTVDGSAETSGTVGALNTAKTAVTLANDSDQATAGQVISVKLIWKSHDGQAEADWASATSAALSVPAASLASAGYTTIDSSENVKVADGSAPVDYEVELRAETKTFSFKVELERDIATSDVDAPVAAGTVVSVDVERTTLDAGTEIKAGGKTLKSSGAANITYFTTTDASGAVVVTVESNSGKINDDIQITVTSGSVSEVVDVKWVAAAIDGVYATNVPLNNATWTVVRGSNVSINYVVVDQFDKAWTRTNHNYRLSFSATGTATAPQPLVLTNGAGTLSFTENTTAAGSFALTATLQYQTGSGNWTNSDATGGAAGTLTQVANIRSVASATAVANVAIATPTLDDGSTAIPATGVVLAGKALKALDNRVTNNTVAGLDITANQGARIVATVTAANNGTVEGASVTFSAPGVAFATTRNGTGVVSMDSITVNSASNGTATVFAYSNTSGKKTVTVTSGSGSKTQDITWANPVVGAGTKVALTAPANAVPGSTITVTGKVTDKWGNAVPLTSDVTTTAAGIVVSYSGPGLVSSLPTKTGADGVFTVRVLLGTNDTGSGVVSASYYAAGTTNTKSGDVLSGQATVVIGSSPAGQVAAFTKRAGDKIQIVSQGSAKVRFMLNGKRVATRSSLGTLNRTFDLVDGKNVIEIYVDGKRVLRRAATK